MISRRLACGAGLVLAALVLPLPSTTFAATDGPEGRDDSLNPLAPETAPGSDGREKPEAKPEPGNDLEGGPEGEGAAFRRLTPISEAELQSIHPRFRDMARLIASGQADKRVMRIYWYSRSRLDPFDTPLPVGWREAGVGVLRDEERTRRGVAAFRARTATPGLSVLAASGPTAEGSVTSGGTAGFDRPAPALESHSLSPVGVWIPIGPFNIPGRMTDIVRPGGNPDELLVTAADGGLWLTVDAGETWTPLSDFEPTLSAGAVALHPSDPDTIWIGTGEGNISGDNYPGVGVFKSTDGGLTWSPSNNFSSEVRRIAVHADAPDRLFVAGSAGCYVSQDGGSTFTQIGAGAGLPTGSRASDVAVRPDDGDTVFCAIWGGANAGIYRSTDGGASWNEMTAGLPANLNRTALAVSESSPDVIVAAADVGGGTLYRSTDGGTNWAEIAGSYQGFCGGQCWYDIAVGIDPADPNVIYAAGINTYGTEDGGSSWNAISSSAGGRGAPNYVHVDQHRVYTPTPDEVFLANDGGIYRSTDRGTTWAEWSIGLDTTQFYGICDHPTDAFWAAGGTQDNGTERRRATDSPEWNQVLGADGGMCMTGPPGSDVVIGEFQNMNIRRSTDGGDFWVDANAGIDFGDPKAWVGILVADPSDRNNMWAGTSKIYRSKDARASNWKRVSNALAGGSLVGALEVAPSDSDTVYAGFANGDIYVATQALKQHVQWSAIRDSAMPLRGVRRLRVSPTDPATVYAVFNGFGTGKIWKSSSGGTSWTDRTGDHPDVPINDLFVDPASPGTMLSATDLGVFRSDDDGASWYGFSTGLPTSAAIEFTWDDAGHTLRVGTHGRSIWEWQEAAATPLAVPDGATAGGTSMTAQRIGTSGDMRVSWDVRTCTAQDYVMLWGDLNQVATRSYAGAECALGTSGFADMALPATGSGNAFFVVVATDGAGTEGPHGYDIDGSVIPASGAGLCGITSQDALATCP